MFFWIRCSLRAPHDPILNLAINARDAMEGFGKLTIEVGNAYIDDACFRRHDDVAPRQYVVLSQIPAAGWRWRLALRYDWRNNPVLTFHNSTPRHAS